MIVLFTDFGVADPYVGQLHAVLARAAPQVRVVDLFHSVPNYDIRAGAFLLPAYSTGFASGTVFLCVVDPGVGSQRRAILLNADECWFVGPDNGLFEVVARRARQPRILELHWRPEHLSASFHGRDWFAPVAAMLARGEMPWAAPTELARPADAPWPEDLAQIIYIDHYGNAVTGVRAATVDRAAMLRVRAHTLGYARVFSEVPAGRAFWYENANGLVEIAVHRGSAVNQLGLQCGDVLEVDGA